eukprot:TRINITY_DN4945_c7_g1_i1.p1 TRINITY_DN4945_c7_g1~~TRINITY_DN4945_c7_g1_i1.p1  ORF type:complete len:999 (+),score=355.12 TRINITY_DN4945_c7_g1_i1:86-2998(+)
MRPPSPEPEQQRLDARPIWIEGVVSGEYEADTLPLLYAEQDDYECYYTTLQQKNPRRRRDLGVIKKLTSKARQMRTQGRLSDCLALLEESLDSRRRIFDESDYQLVAAQQHFCCTCIQFASHTLTRQDLPAAHALFKLAKEALQRQFPATERPLFEVMLYNNWANYWYRRGRWCAAAQAAGTALTRWSKICTEDRHRTMSAYLGVRYGCCLLQSGKPQEAGPVLMRALRDIPHAAARDCTVSTESAIVVHTVVVRDEVEKRGAEHAQLFASRPLRELVLCITSPYSHYDTRLPLPAATRIAALCNLAQAKAALMAFKLGEELLRQCAVLFTEAHAASPKDGNVWWWQQIQIAFSHCQMAMKHKRHAQARVDHRNPAELGLQRLVREDTQQELERRRQRAAARRQGEESEPDEDDEMGGTQSALDASGPTEGAGAADGGTPTAGPANDDLEPRELRPDSDESGEETEPVWQRLIPALKFKGGYRIARKEARLMAQATKVADPFTALAKRDEPICCVAQRVVAKKERKRERGHEQAQQRAIQRLQELNATAASPPAEGEEAGSPQFKLYGAEDYMPNSLRQELREAAAGTLKGPPTKQAQQAAAEEEKAPYNPAVREPAAVSNFRKAAVSYSPAGSPRTISPRSKRRARAASTPAAILSDTLAELHIPPPADDEENVVLLAAQRRLAATEERQARLEAYLGALQKELERAQQAAETLAQEREELAAAVASGSAPPPPQPAEEEAEPDGPRPQRAPPAPSPPRSRAPAGGGGGGYCDTGAAHAPSLLASRIAQTPEPRAPPRRHRIPIDHGDLPAGAEALYGTRKGRPKGATPEPTPASSLAGDVRQAAERQKRLRALLPHLEPNGATYRMVTKELAANQQVLTAQSLQRRKRRMLEVANKGRLALQAFGPTQGSPGAASPAASKHPADALAAASPVAAKWLCAAATWALANPVSPGTAGEAAAAEAPAAEEE